MPFTAPTSSAMVTTRTASVRFIFQLVKRLGMIPGNDDSAQKLQMAWAERARHLLEIGRDALHPVQAVDGEDRRTGNEHHEINARLDTLEP